MNQQIKEEWITLLESGEVEQGKHQLRTQDNTFCCLGVLCTIAERHGIGHWGLGESGDETLFYTTSYDVATGVTVLPDEVVQWAGLDNILPEVVYDNVKTNLAELNDAYALTFKEIAKVIREQL